MTIAGRASEMIVRVLPAGAVAAMRLHSSIFGALSILGWAALLWSGSAQAAETTITVLGSSGPFSATAVFTFNDDGATTILSIQLSRVGEHVIALGRGGGRLGPGLYFYRVEAPDAVLTGRLMVIE